MKHFNKRALIKAKSIVGAGKVEPSTPDGMVTFRIRDRDVLKKHVFPIFDRFPLLSTKHYDYVRLRQIASLLDDVSLSRKHRDEKSTFCILSTHQEMLSRPFGIKSFLLMIFTLETENHSISQNLELTQSCHCLGFQGLQKLKAVFTLCVRTLQRVGIVMLLESHKGAISL